MKQVDPQNSNVVYCGTRTSGLLRTTDGGSTWTTVSTFTGSVDVGIRSVAIDYTSTLTSSRSSKVYAAYWGKGIYRSTDGGNTFSLLSGSPTTPYQMQVASNGTLYVTSQAGVFKYVGTTWTNITPPTGSDIQYNGLDVDKNDPSKIIVCMDRSSSNGGSDFGLPVFYSTNAGSTWSGDRTISSMTYNYLAAWYKGTGRYSAATAVVRFSPANSSIVYVGDWYQVMRTNNITASTVVWNQLLKGHEETVVPAIASPPHPSAGQTFLLSATPDNGGFRHTSMTSYPSRITSLSDGTGVDYCESDPNYLVWFGPSGLRISSNNGSSWTSGTTPGPGGKIAYSSTNTNSMVALTIGGGVYYSTDRGATWSASTGTPSGGTSSKFSYDVPIVGDKVNGNTFYYIHSDGTFYRSTNSGASFTQVATVPISNTQWVKSVFGKANHLWAGSVSGGLYHSTNGGNSWSAISGVSAARGGAVGKALTSTSYPTVFIYATIGGVTGIYQSTDEGGTWTRINNANSQIGDNPRVMEADREVFGKVYISTKGRGIYQLQSTKSVSNLPPNISLTSPSSDSIYDSAANITIAASAVDSDGSIVKVEFYQGTTLLGSDNSSPYIYGWNSVSPGNYSITAKAYDNAGASTISSPVIVTVKAPVLNLLPSADAGEDTMLVLPVDTMTLKGTGNDVDGKLVAYLWTKIAGPSSVMISAPNLPKTQVRLGGQGAYSFEFQVTDNDGAVGKDTMTVTVVGGVLHLHLLSFCKD